jgi:YegS/Rv2252/BmrU family lipid kinase
MIALGGRPGCSSSGSPWVVIAANPFSGSGPTRELVAELEESLRRRHIEPRVIWDGGQRRMLLGDADLTRGCRCVVAVGGDGTVADVINELPAGVPLATLPAGTENLFASEFGFGRSGLELAERIAAGRTRTIDLARAGDRRFSLMMSAGFDAAVAHRLAQWRAASPRLRRVNRLSYIKPIFDVIRSYAYTPLEVEADGVRVEGAEAMVFNLPHYGFELRFAPGARADDGMLDWVVFDAPGIGRLAGHLMNVLSGRHQGSPGVLHGRARRVVIRAASAVPVQVDGDAAGRTPVEVEVVPQALRVLVQ